MSKRTRDKPCPGCGRLIQRRALMCRACYRGNSATTGAGGTSTATDVQSNGSTCAQSSCVPNTTRATASSTATAGKR